MDRHAVLATRAHRHDVAHSKVLQLGNDAPRALTTQVVEEVVAVPAGTGESGLDQPRPDPLRRRGDSDCPGSVERRPRHEVVAGKAAGDLFRRRAPSELPGTHVPDVEDNRRGGYEHEAQTYA